MDSVALGVVRCAVGYFQSCTAYPGGGVGGCFRVGFGVPLTTWLRGGSKHKGIDHYQISCGRHFARSSTHRLVKHNEHAGEGGTKDGCVSRTEYRCVTARTRNVGTSLELQHKIGIFNKSRTKRWVSDCTETCSSIAVRYARFERPLHVYFGDVIATCWGLSPAFLSAGLPFFFVE